MTIDFRLKSLKITRTFINYSVLNYAYPTVLYSKEISHFYHFLKEWKVRHFGF